MLYHNFLISIRNFFKNKLSFFINVFGLAIGLASVILIYMWISSELGVDKFHENDDRLFQVMENQVLGGEIVTQGATPDLLAETLKNEVSGIEYAAAVAPSSWFGDFTLRVGLDVIKQKGQFVGKDYFSIFSFTMLKGDAKTVLHDRNNIVISKDLATKLFGSPEQAIGQSIEWNLIGKQKESRVAGVFETLSANSTEEFDFVIPYQKFVDLSNEIGRPMTWGNHGPHTYIVLEKNVTSERIDKLIKDFITKKDKNQDNVILFLKEYSSNYLYGEFENGTVSGGRISNVRLFALIAIFILTMACINFMNLSTAKATRRLKEIGVKKAIGASRLDLIIQYLGESVILSFIAMFFAIIIVLLVLPQFNEIIGKTLEFNFTLEMILALAFICIVTGLIAGSYPAIYLSGFEPAKVLKGKLSNSFLEIWTRKGLVIFQFILSVILIVSVMVVYQQIQFIQNKNLGFDKANIVYFTLEGRAKSNLDPFLKELKAIPGVENATSIENSLVGNEGYTVDVNWQGKDLDQLVNFTSFQINHDFIETLGIELSEGRSFSENYVADNTKIILNKAAIEVMGLKSPIGTTIQLWGENKEIIGVVENFYFESFRNNVKPAFMILSPNKTLISVVRIKNGAMKNTLSRIGSFYKNYTNFSFDYKFLDDDFEKLYETENRIAELSKYFALLAIFISCLGLFGLSAFTLERRKKEIGIRKSLGSTNMGIVYVLSKEFVVLVLFSLFISLPLSFYITKSWLMGFSYRIELQVWYFLLAGLFAIIIASLSIILQTIKSINVDPVEYLREND
ncbi:ABC transporter permease [Aquimarina intermedia]|nr:ABC transporter permease [Aquimarina intermedia]